jgi:glycosyltransferase involved in cell wall biosynthesis
MAGDPWAGCEELWSRTALELMKEGFAISASIAAWSPLDPRAASLLERGIDVWFRPRVPPLSQRAWRGLMGPESSYEKLELQRLLRAKSPDLIVLSEGGSFAPIDVLELCVAKKLPFATILHAGSEYWWPTDDVAERYRRAYSAARRCYFVSKANLRLVEKQIGGELANAEVVWNPFNVSLHFAPAWPKSGAEGEFRFACVGRLDPVPKGQDILFEALSGPAWAVRRWKLTLYGEGSKRNSLERLAQRLGLADRIEFAGVVSVAEIWQHNHVLVMPSRFEGLPLAVVEAMLCGRPVVATDVAGHAEVIKEGVTGFLADAPTPASIAAALERFWERRAEAEAIGKAASQRIRQLVPPDPVRLFSIKIKEILGLADVASHRSVGR